MSTDVEDIKRHNRTRVGFGGVFAGHAYRENVPVSVKVSVKTRARFTSDTLTAERGVRTAIAVTRH